MFSTAHPTHVANTVGYRRRSRGRNGRITDLRTVLADSEVLRAVAGTVWL